MSLTVEQASGPEHDEPQNASVYDFLYCDSRRIASFLAQFDDSGYLEKVVQKETSQRTSKRGWNASVSGSVPLVAQGNAAVSISPEAMGSEASERSYDPLWTNARTFLDFAETEGLIQRNVSEARIGQFVLATGRLSVFDMALLKVAWENPAVLQAMRAEQARTNQQSDVALNRKQRRQQGTNRSEPVDELKSVLDYFKHMPHKIISSFQFENENFWSILQPQFLTGSSEDIALKHGLSVQGEWSMLGIIDAMPVLEGSTTELDAMQMISGALGLNGMWQAIVGIGPTLRAMLGRPVDAWGVTPLLIFREIQR